jgi:NIMA (never in mitosis gene a)-related kinase
MQHPNIICYYDSFEEDGILMIEMEYAEGGCVTPNASSSHIYSNYRTLAQMLVRRDSPMDEKQILIMFQQMVSAVQYLHENNVLHR